MKTVTHRLRKFCFAGSICFALLYSPIVTLTAFAQGLKIEAPLQPGDGTFQQAATIHPSEPTSISTASDEARCFVKFRRNSSSLTNITTLLKSNALLIQKSSTESVITSRLPASSLASSAMRSNAVKIISERVLALETITQITPESISADQESVGGINRLFILHARDKTTLAQLMADLENNGDIEYIEPEQTRQSRLLPISAAFDDKNTPSLTQSANDQYFSYQWSLANTGQRITSVMSAGKAGADINIFNAWGITTGNSNIIVAIIDTGVPSLTSSAAVDFSNRYISPYNFALKTTDATDDDGHGSNIASIIGALGNNGRLVAGINWQSRLMPLKVSTSRGSIPNTLLVQAITYAANQGARVINMSLGGTNFSNAERDALRYAASKGCISVAAMGNDNTSTPDYPAAFSTDPTTNVIAVGATDNIDQRCNPFVIGSQSSGGSNFGSHISFTAPGNAILGIGSNGTSLSYYSGTSQATPMVTGIISLLLSARPSMQFKDVFNALKAGARDMVGLASEDTPGWDPYYGWGRVDAYRSLAYVTTSVQETGAASSQQTLVYPNPASSVLYVNLPPHPAETIKLSLVDLFGRIIIEHTALPTVSRDEFDISLLATGAYRIVLTRASGVETLPAFIVH